MQAPDTTEEGTSFIDRTHHRSPQQIASEFEPALRPERLAGIERCCLALFERWCENRSVIPLAYLLHVWPVPTLTARLTRRLANTLRHLSKSHGDMLDPIDRQLIRQTIDAIDVSLDQ